MLFPTIRFAIFFALVLPASWLLMPKPVRWRVFMVAASLVFYGAWSWHYVPLLVLSIVGNQVLATAVDRAPSDRARQVRVGAAVVANVLVLGWYKYAGFFADNSSGLLRAVGIEQSWRPPDLILPVGISFFTFQALSYVIDVGRRKLHPVPLADFAVYLSFFPHLVAGPIVRAAEFLPQLRHPRDPRRVDASLGFWLIAAGLFKKVVVATYLADRAVDPLFGFPGQHGGFEALVGVYAYAVQIYADFSGYTDIAIGLALLLGFRFPANFDAPYTATSLADFWRRWHMTLSRWLRDYVYVPLGGNRHGARRLYCALLATMLLGGLWHGAAWTFLAWGAIHGAGLAVERWRGWNDAGARRPWLGRIVTFHFVCLGWIFFRAGSVGDAVDIVGRILTGSSSVALNPVVVVVAAAAIAAQFVPAGTVERLRVAFSRWTVAPQAAALASTLVVIDALGPAGVAPFIYFQF